MSVESVAIVLHHSHAGGTAKLVLVGIANHDGDGGAWPRIETLMKYAGRSERTVQAALGELQALGELVVHRNAGGSSSTPRDRRPNLYEITLNCPPECEGGKQHRTPDDDVAEAAGDTPGAPVDNHSDGVQPAAPRPLRGAAECTPGVRPSAPRGVQPAAPEPSLRTIHELGVDPQPHVTSAREGIRAARRQVVAQ